MTHLRPMQKAACTAGAAPLGVLGRLRAFVSRAHGLGAARSLLACCVCLQLSAACGRLGFALRAEDAGQSQSPVSDADPALDEAAAFDASALDAALAPRDAAGPSATPDADTPDMLAPDDARIASGPIVNAATARLVRGFEHTCFITAGQLFCWGHNQAAQLGLGDKTDRDTPVQVGTAEWADACGGELHACGVQTTGQLYCWGANSKGQLGTGDVLERTSPALIDGIADWVAVTCDGQFTCALRQGGALYCWGENLEGALGQNDQVLAPDRLTPSVVAQGSSFRMVSAGQGHACAVRMDGALFCWGRNTSGQGGIAARSPEQLRVPTRVGTASDWLMVAAGQEQTCGIRAGGTLWCWGQDLSGALGLNLTSATFVDTPTRVGSMTGWQQVSAARLHTCGLTATGELYCWGRNVEGQLGTAATGDANIPMRVGMASDWQEIVAGAFHSCGRRNSGVWCWGENDLGQLGLGDAMRRTAPAKLKLP
jgi:alpha-tubulin suppressor-like RCC1 family protein